jgi:hypothetical protein
MEYLINLSRKRLFFLLVYLTLLNCVLLEPSLNSYRSRPDSWSEGDKKKAECEVYCPGSAQKTRTRREKHFQVQCSQGFKPQKENFFLRKASTDSTLMLSLARSSRFPRGRINDTNKLAAKLFTFRQSCSV